MCEYDKAAPLSPAKGETARANKALNDYFKMGGVRSVAALHRQYKADAEAGKPVPTKNHGTLRNWSQVWRWGERILAQQALDVAAVQEARKRRIEEQPGIELADAEMLREKAREILDKLPLLKYKAKKSKDGKTITEIVIPASSTEYNAATRMLNEAVRLERLALGLPTSITSSDVTSGGEKLKQEVIVIKWDGDGDTVPEATFGADGDTE